MAKRVIYTTLQGKRLNLKKLNEEQKGLLRRFYCLYRNGHEFPGFCNAMHSYYNLQIMGAFRHDGQYWVNLKTAHSVIYQVLQDLGDRLAIKQSLLKPSANCRADFTENEQALEEFLS